MVVTAVPSEAAEAPGPLSFKATGPIPPGELARRVGSDTDRGAWAPHRDRYVVLRLDGPVDRGARDRIAAAGGRAVAFVPRDAVVVAFPRGVRDMLARARRIEGVVEVARFGPALKISPSRVDASLDPATVLVELFPGENVEELATAIEVRFRGAVEVARVRPGLAGRPSFLELVLPAGGDDVLGDLAAAEAVAWITRLDGFELHNDQQIWIGQSYDRVNGPGEADAPDPKSYAITAPVWSRGITGEGQLVAVSDTGLEVDTCFWSDPMHAVVPQQVSPPGAIVVDPSHRKVAALNGTNPLALGADGAFRHGTHVAATVAGDDFANLAGSGVAGHDSGDGVAPGARIVFQDIGTFVSGSCSTSVLVNSVEDLLIQAHDAGARISTNSWGTGDDRADEVDTVVWDREDLVVVFSAGNDGTNSINELALNKNGICVGASENYDPTFVDEFGILDPENMAAFSSVGPALDGRVKPDLVAPGYRVRSNKFPTEYHADEAECSPGDPSIEICTPSFGGCYWTFTDETCSTDWLQGTSMATPAVAGLAALVRQYYEDGFWPTGAAIEADGRAPSAALVKATLIASARSLTGHRYERRGANKEDLGPLGDAPDAVQGWGSPVLDDALYFAGDARRTWIEDVANADGLRTGEESVARLAVSAGEPLVATLVWTDPPAASYVVRALVNDLDLELVAPDGTLYRGNVFTADDPAVPGDEVSVPDPAGRNDVDNVEVVRVPAPAAGTWTVRVSAVDVPGFGTVDTQGFALVVAGVVTDSPGAVPGARGVPGAPLRVDRAAGDDVTLTWSAACLGTTTDYTVLEGPIGDFSAHAPATCSTGGATEWTFTPEAGSRYFLVVPRGDRLEGSYGTDSGGVERTRPAEACLPQRLAGCS